MFGFEFSGMFCGYGSFVARCNQVLPSLTLALYGELRLAYRHAGGISNAVRDSRIAFGGTGIETRIQFVDVAFGCE